MRDREKRQRSEQSLAKIDLNDHDVSIPTETSVLTRRSIQRHRLYDSDFDALALFALVPSSSLSAL